MGVSWSSPDSHFPFGTCGVSLQGSFCETETKGASPLGTLAPQRCLRTAHPSMPWTQCQGDTVSGSCRRAAREKMETGPAHPGPVRCLLPCPQGQQLLHTLLMCVGGRGLRDDKDRDWFGLLHSHSTSYHGAHSPWSSLNSVHCPSHCPSPHE